jgi:hypothetical protein
MAETYNPEKTLHAVVVCSNPVQFKSRYRLHRQFMQRYSGYTESRYKLHLTVVEIAFGNRAFRVTEPDNPDHVQLRTIDELWHKENMINLGVQRLTENHPGWLNLAWIDNDVQFQNPRWLRETIHSLDHYEVVQMWEDAVDMGPNQELIQTHKSFLSQYLKGAPYNRKHVAKGYPSGHWHPGFAWACTRKAYDGLGGLIDFAILGAGDNHMAHGLLGMMDKTFAPGIAPEYTRDLAAWQERADDVIRRDVGYVSGMITHWWHGKKANRRYWDRWKILTENKYVPRTDLKRDAFGLYQVDVRNGRQMTLRDQIRAYFRQRNEDSIDLE